MIYIIYYFIYSVAFCMVRFSVPNNVNVLFRTILKFSCLLVLNICDRICYIYIFYFLPFLGSKTKQRNGRTWQRTSSCTRCLPKIEKPGICIFVLSKEFLAKNNFSYGRFMLRAAITSAKSARAIVKVSQSVLIHVLLFHSDFLCSLLFPWNQNTFNVLPCFCCSNKSRNWLKFWEVYEFCFMREKRK